MSGRESLTRGGGGLMEKRGVRTGICLLQRKNAKDSEVQVCGKNTGKNKKNNVLENPRTKGKAEGSRIQEEGAVEERKREGGGVLGRDGNGPMQGLLEAKGNPGTTSGERVW